MDSPLLEASVILILILFNGWLAMSEIALVSARKSSLLERAKRDGAGFERALEMTESPGRSLAAIQVGITLISVLNGAFGGATLAGRLEAWLAPVPMIGAYADKLGLALVVIIITYTMLILGELVPKRLALVQPETILGAVARPLSGLARLVSPAVGLLNTSTNVVLGLIGSQSREQRPVTEGEIKALLQEGANAGTFAEVERELVGRIFRTADRTLASLATPRTEIAWLDLADPVEESVHKIISSDRARLPVCEGGLDHVVGVLEVRDLLSDCMGGRPIDLRSHARKVDFIPESARAFEAMETFRRTRRPIALVMDEYGGVQGLVTTNDLLDALVGDLPEGDELNQEEVKQEGPGVWRVDGMLSVEEFKGVVGLEKLPQQGRGLYETVGGLALTRFGDIPKVGDSFRWADLSFVVLRMDGFRVAELRVRREPPRVPGSRH